LCFSVSDDGAGYDVGHTPMGSGLRNMADRLAALGGRLEVRSAPGRGTTITGYLPVPVSVSSSGQQPAAVTNSVSSSSSPRAAAGGGRPAVG
jgi:signal transduction histidine kinase